MPPSRQHQSIHTHNTYNNDLSQIAQIHGGNLPNRYNRFKPYVARIPSQGEQHVRAPRPLVLHPLLLDRIRDTQEAAVNKSSQKKDASRLREFLAFCDGLGIGAHAALPAREDILLAWASSHAGRLAGKTVGHT